MTLTGGNLLLKKNSTIMKVSATQHIHNSVVTLPLISFNELFVIHLPLQGIIKKSFGPSELTYSTQQTLLTKSSN